MQNEITFQQAVTIIEDLVKYSLSFKIGKTSPNENNRLRGRLGEFNRIKIIRYSTYTKLFTEWEKTLINYFKNYSPYSNKCKNEQLGSGSDKEELIYVVYKVFDFNQNHY